MARGGYLLALMFGQVDNLHSQIVGWSKVILPLCGLGILSTLFLFARNEAPINEAEIAKIEEIARQQKINTPRFSGVTADGVVVALSAKTAQPSAEAPQVMQIEGIRLTLDAPDGSELRVTATEGQINSSQEVARFLGLARLDTSSGYAMETNGLTADFKTGEVTSDGQLEVRAPFGSLTAGRVTFRSAVDDTGQQMLFTDGVKLLYTPPKAQAEEAQE